MIQALKSLTREGITKLSDATTRLDDWQNRVTGFGTSIDKTTYTSFVGGLRLTPQQLSNLYHGDDLAARMVDIVPDELLREGFTVETGDAALNAALSEQLDALGLDGKIADGWRWGRLYGGAALVLGADDGRSAATPLVAERAKALNYVHTVDRRYLWPLTYYSDPTSAKLGQPETYMVSAVSAHSEGQGYAIVHETRLVLFGGATTGSLEREQNNSWDHSVLDRALQPLAAFNTGWKAVELLLTDANQAVFKMQGLAEVIAAGGEEAMKRRMQMVDLCRSVMRAMVIDAGSPEANAAPEEFTRQSVSFADIPQTLDKFMLRLAAAVQIPVTILMGQSPAGMNATGDNDFRWFYDRIRSEQTRKLAPKIRRIVNVMLATKQFNAKPEAITIKFPSLWTETPSVRATTRKTLLEGDAIAITNGVLVPAEVATQRFSPEGFDSDIQLSDEGKTAREAELKGDLEDLSKPPEEREPTPAEAGGGFGGGGFGHADADDQPREENGQFASTDGGGGSASSGKGGSGRIAVAHERLASAQATHAQATADHDQAKAEHESARQAVDSSLAHREGELKAASTEAHSLAEEAKSKLEQAKADKKSTARELARAEKENDSAHEKLAEEFDAANEATSETHDAIADQIEATHAAESAAATTDEHQAAADAKRTQALAENSAKQAATEKAASDAFDARGEAIQSAHDERVGALEARLEIHETAVESLKDHAKALAKEARTIDKQQQHVDRVKAAVDAGQLDRAEDLANDKLDPDRSATAAYIADQQSTDHDSYRAAEAAALSERATKSEFEFAPLADTKERVEKAAAKFDRTSRAVKAHEREVNRLARKTG